MPNKNKRGLELPGYSVVNPLELLPQAAASDQSPLDFLNSESDITSPLAVAPKQLSQTNNVEQFPTPAVLSNGVCAQECERQEIEDFLNLIKTENYAKALKQLQNNPLLARQYTPRPENVKHYKPKYCQIPILFHVFEVMMRIVKINPANPVIPEILEIIKSIVHFLENDIKFIKNVYGDNFLHLVLGKQLPQNVWDFMVLLPIWEMVNHQNNALDTPLHDFIKANWTWSWNRCELLLSKGANPTIKNDEGKTPVYHAADNFRSKLEKYILEKYPSMDVSAEEAVATSKDTRSNNKMNIPDDMELIKIHEFNDENKVWSDNKEIQLLIDLINHKRIADIRKMLANNKELVEAYCKIGEKPYPIFFHVVAGLDRSYMAILQSFLKILTSDQICGMRDGDNNTVLQVAIRTVNTMVLEELFKSGIDKIINEKNKAGYTALHECLLRKNNKKCCSLVKILMAHGADPKVPCSNGLTAFKMAKNNKILDLLKKISPQGEKKKDFMDEVGKTDSQPEQVVKAPLSSASINKTLENIVSNEDIGKASASSGLLAQSTTSDQCEPRSKKSRLMQADIPEEQASLVPVWNNWHGKSKSLSPSRFAILAGSVSQAPLREVGAQSHEEKEVNKFFNLIKIKAYAKALTQLQDNLWLATKHTPSPDSEPVLFYVFKNIDSMIPESLKIVRIMVDNLKDIASMKDGDGNNFLHIALRKKLYTAIWEFLKSLKIWSMINSPNKSLATPFHDFIRANPKSSWKKCEYLLSQGADLNAKDNQLKTPVDYASDDLRYELERYKAFKLSDVNISREGATETSNNAVDIQGDLVFPKIKKSNRDNEVKSDNEEISLLVRLIDANEHTVIAVKKMLLNNPSLAEASCNIGQKLCPLLFYAAVNAKKAKMKILQAFLGSLTNDKICGLRDGDKNSILHAVIATATVGLLSELFKYGVGRIINEKNGKGYTVLHECLLQRNDHVYAIVKTLLFNGADPTIVCNSLGVTAFELTESQTIHGLFKKELALRKQVTNEDNRVFSGQYNEIAGNEIVSQLTQATKTPISNNIMESFEEYIFGGSVNGMLYFSDDYENRPTEVVVDANPDSSSDLASDSEKITLVEDYDVPLRRQNLRDSTLLSNLGIFNNNIIFNEENPMQIDDLDASIACEY